MSDTYRFSFGPWNIHEGADPFGPPVRESLNLETKLTFYKELGFDAVQFHDDDAVPDLEDKSAADIDQTARQMKRTLDASGLTAEFVAPRLWEHPLGVDGGFTANDSQVRKWAIERSKKAMDIAHALGCDLIVLWLAREGTYIRESKNPLDSIKYLVEAINSLLAYSPTLRIAIEPKPNEPMDHAYLPTIGHALAVAEWTSDPSRVGGLIETAHAQLAGLDPSDEMAFAISRNKLWSVHLNDQNGMKYDQDKTFGSVNLRAAFNQVRVLELGKYAQTGAYIGLDVKAMRTQKQNLATTHLVNSRSIFLALVDKYRSFDQANARESIQARDYELLELHVLRHLLG